MKRYRFLEPFGMRLPTNGANCRRAAHHTLIDDMIRTKENYTQVINIVTGTNRIVPTITSRFAFLSVRFPFVACTFAVFFHAGPACLYLSLALINWRHSQKPIIGRRCTTEPKEGRGRRARQRRTGAQRQRQQMFAMDLQNGYVTGLQHSRDFPNS